MPLSRPIRSKTQTNHDLLVPFPTLGTGYVYLLWVLFSSLGNLSLLWLVGVITLVCILRHAFEKHFKSIINLLCKLCGELNGRRQHTWQVLDAVYSSGAFFLRTKYCYARFLCIFFKVSGARMLVVSHLVMENVWFDWIVGWQSTANGKTCISSNSFGLCGQTPGS